MVSMQDLISFLWDLMHNDKTKSQFERDPHGTLSDHGLSGVTSCDVRDAQMMMQDQGMAHPREGWAASAGHDNAIDEIRHTSTYQVDRSSHIDYHNDQQFTVVDIDDRDTLVNDSFNGDETTTVTAIQDNDTINHNTDVDVTHVEDSFNDGAAEEPAADTPDQSTVDSSDPVTLPDASPDPDLDPDADASPDEDAAADPLANPDPDPDPSPCPPDVETVDGAGEELDTSVV